MPRGQKELVRATAQGGEGGRIRGGLGGTGACPSQGCPPPADPETMVQQYRHAEDSFLEATDSAQYGHWQ